MADRAPAWVADAVFYQIFPDRFANGNSSNDPLNVLPWGSPPDLWGFQGGDLRGIIQKLDYLLELGVNALYLNPIFQASSNHRYNTTDYYRIDSKLGDVQDLRELLDQAHRHDMRVVLDGVFNHCGRGFFAFNDLLENQQHSPYRSWFHVKSFPVRAYGPGKAETYLGWWDHKELPKFNTDTAQVRDYLLGVARHWIEFGVDGWRLDVPNEINDDGFWAEFRAVVKRANPEAYLLGEIWEADPRWVGPNHFDGLLHYPLRSALLGFLDGKVSGSAFGETVEALSTAFPAGWRGAHYITLGSHDTPRLRTELRGDLAKVRLAMLMQFAHPGAPGIYYGDEIGLQGGKDPACRGAFPWEPGSWAGELREHLRKLIRLRRELPQLRRGELSHLAPASGEQVVALAARLEGSPALALLLNRGPHPQSATLPAGELDWPDGLPVREALSGREIVVQGGRLRCDLDACSGALLVPA